VKWKDFYTKTLCNAVTLTFDPFTLNIFGTSGVTWPKSVRKMSKIEQSGSVIDNFASFNLLPLRHVVTLTFDPLTLNVFSRWMSKGQTLYRIWAKSNNSRLSYLRFSIFQGDGIPNFTCQKGVDETAPNFKRTELHHHCTRSETLVAIDWFISK